MLSNSPASQPVQRPRPRWPPSKLGARFFHRDELEALNGSGRPRQPDAHSCPQYIGDLNCQITDAEIAFRESVVDRSVGPQLLNCATLRRPNCRTQPEAFTPALSWRIVPEAIPYFEGTGSLYSGESDRVCLLTGCGAYIVTRNNDRKPCRKVILFGNKVYQGVEIAPTATTGTVAGIMPTQRRRGPAFSPTSAKRTGLMLVYLMAAESEYS